MSLSLTATGNTSHWHGTCSHYLYTRCTRCIWRPPSAVSHYSAPAVRLCLSLKSEHFSHHLFTPLHLTPGYNLHTGHLGWPAASPWQAGTLPGPCACRWWSRSSARRPLSTPRQHWNFDKLGRPSAPTGKTEACNGHGPRTDEPQRGKALVRGRNTYSKYASHNPSVVLSKGLSIGIIWVKNTQSMTYRNDHA